MSPGLASVASASKPLMTVPSSSERSPNDVVNTGATFGSVTVQVKESVSVNVPSLTVRTTAWLPEDVARAARWLASVGISDLDLRAAAVAAGTDPADLAADLATALPDALVRVVDDLDYRRDILAEARRAEESTAR